MNRLLAFYLAQTHADRELVILNTAPVPLTLSDALKERKDILLVNQQDDSINRRPYANVGGVRRDAVLLARGDVFCLFDDDDMYFPYHIAQGVAGLIASGKRAWKPKESLYTPDGGQTFSLCSNTLEASVFVWMDDIRRLGFRPESGPENLNWYNGLRDAGQMEERGDAPPSYCYEWGSPIAPHKQSGDMANPANFDNHKNASLDFGQGKPLTGEFDLEPLYARIKEQFPQLPL